MLFDKLNQKDRRKVSENKLYHKYLSSPILDFEIKILERKHKTS